MDASLLERFDKDNIVVEKLNRIQFSFNHEIMSGGLILAVGFIYLGYNWVDHIH